MKDPMRAIAFLIVVFVLIVSGILLVVIAAHAQTTGVIVSPGRGMTFIYPGIGQSPTVIMPPTGAPSYYYPPAQGIQPLPMVPTVPTLPSLYAPAPSYSAPSYAAPDYSAPSYGGF